MLGGLDPVIIFQFAKKVDPDFVGPAEPGVISKIPIISQIPTLIDQPPIPVYLSESLSGLQIDSEDKTVDIDTDVETLTNGEPPDVNQKGISSVVSIQITALRDNPGVTLLSALIDQVFDKLTSKEYAITYLHGPITVFRGVLQGFSLSTNSDTNLVTMKIDLSKGTKNPAKPSDVVVVPGITGAVPL